MAKNDDSETEDMVTIQRSPKYPAMSLSDAIAKVRLLYEKDKTAGTPLIAALSHMGYKSRSGPANTAVAALKRFGLIDSKTGGRIVPSARAVTILVLPESDARRKVALREAALSPSLYRKIYDQFSPTGNMPSQESLEHELLLGGKFNHNAIKSLVKDLWASFVLAGLTDKNGVILGSAGKAPRPESPASDAGMDGSVASQLIDSTFGGIWTASRKAGGSTASMRDLPITLPSLEVAVIRVPFPMSAADYATLEAALKSFKATLVTGNDGAPKQASEPDDPDADK